MELIDVLSEINLNFEIENFIKKVDKSYKKSKRLFIIVLYYCKMRNEIKVLLI